MAEDAGRLLQTLQELFGMRTICLLALLWVGQAAAESIQIQHRGLTLNGNLVTVESADPDLIFLIVHGTWGHQGMEIITSLQLLLAESGHDSLAITLSLGISDRQGFLQCQPPIRADHGNAVAEIHAWVEYLEPQSRQIVIVGHSRGGNQVALYDQAFELKGVTHLVLIAPMSWDDKESARLYKEKFGVSLASVLNQATDKQGEMITADLLQCSDIEVLATSFLSYYSREPNRNTAELLQSTRLPVLVIQGTEDELARGYKSQESLPKSNPLVEDYRIEGAGHFFRDLYADELVEHMLEWLAK